KGDTMKIIEQKRREGTVLTLFGDMLEPDSCRLAERVKELAEIGDKNLVIDLHGVRRMNSAFGLGTLMTCYLLLNKIGGELRLANLTDKERRILEITKLHHVFQIYDNIEDALGSLNRESKPLMKNSTVKKVTEGHH
ncbi:MAG: STAS domain-containing protein, partial [Calditrichia bacterium]